MFAGRSSPFEISEPHAPPTGARAASGPAGQDLFWMALAASIAGFVLLVFRPNRDRLAEAEAEARLLAAEIVSFESRVARLRRWQRSLATRDRDAWASVARSRLGWLSPGEKMIRPTRPPFFSGPRTQTVRSARPRIRTMR